MLLLVPCVLPTWSAAEVLFSWSQIVVDSKLSVRAVVPSGEACPDLYVDSQSVKMSTRADPEPGAFEDRVCESLLSPSSTPRVIRIGSRRLPDISARVGYNRRDGLARIVFVGDTGCRVSRLLEQDCKSPDKWPLRQVLSGISNQDPDLVVHVGDYLYREVECTDESKCDKRIYGDKSSTWAEDWLLPLQSVSDKLVFLFVRGNHESCNRAYKGWFRYLDAYPLSKQRYENCEKITDPWVLDLGHWDMGDVGFYVYDSSSSDEIFHRGSDVQSMRQKFLKGISSVRSSQMWLLTHRPLWAYWKYGMEYYGNVPQTRAIAEVMPEKFVAVVSGHVHFAQILSMRRDEHDKKGGGACSQQASGRACMKSITQIISGNGGAHLNAVKGEQPMAALSLPTRGGSVGAGLNKIAKSAYRSLALHGFVIDDVSTLGGFGFCRVDIPVNGEGHPVTQGKQAAVTFHGVGGEELRKFLVATTSPTGLRLNR
ncbi:putative phosphoesterase [Anaplasma centrale str. Israel]|uniref:Putative phosphoesterase n=1 Tax=Anaplasma centrale (strain Israel) TaxID=574556 RepID=D1ASS2_ANACI|nr:metallophosphoesterase [Anaplasma centrale]ACZ49525.1 putative phosphoesterase [Anaplasma centrale str. Israel]